MSEARRRTKNFSVWCYKYLKQEEFQKKTIAFVRIREELTTAVPVFVSVISPDELPLGVKRGGYHVEILCKEEITGRN